MRKGMTRFCALLFLIVLAGSLISAPPALACTSCNSEAGGESSSQTSETVDIVDNHTMEGFISLREFLILVVWGDNILPAMMQMAEQLSAVAMQQVQIIGSFFDAEQQLEAQRTIQKLQAGAHKDYQPSEGMCKFGSSVKSLAASERKSEYTAIVLSQRSMDRQLGQANTGDVKSRIQQFKEKYCDPADNNNGLGDMCGKGAADRQRVNKDIDYARTVAYPWTLDVDFTDPELRPDEEDLFALASNLYGHEVFSWPGKSLIESPESDPGKKTSIIEPMQRYFLDARALVAKRSVAENSFNAIASMKAKGTEGSAQFINEVLKEIVSEGEDFSALLGENPSYYAQMEVLTKKIYQDPAFFTNLYDTPANVERKGVALQAIALMQKFDMFKSYLRNEAALSILLEMAVLELQDEAESEIER